MGLGGCGWCGRSHDNHAPGCRDASARLAAKKHLLPPDLLRLIVRNMNEVSEDFNHRFTLEQLLAIYATQIASDWDYAPDRWTQRQIMDAIAGIAPDWDDEGNPKTGVPPLAMCTCEGELTGNRYVRSHRPECPRYTGENVGQEKSVARETKKGPR